MRNSQHCDQVSNFAEAFFVGSGFPIPSPLTPQVVLLLRAPATSSLRPSKRSGRKSVLKASPTGANRVPIPGVVRWSNYQYCCSDIFSPSYSVWWNRHTNPVIHMTTATQETTLSSTQFDPINPPICRAPSL